MKSSFIRIVSLSMLVIVLAVFSGGAVLASTTGGTAVVDSCCGNAEDGDRHPADDAGEPCSSPDCHCLTCLELAVAAVIDLGHRRAEITSFLPRTPSLHATPFIVPIDQPPEQA